MSTSEWVVNDTAVDPHHAVITIDAEGRIVDLDPGAEEVFGLRSSEALGRPLAELIIPGRIDSEHWIRIRQAPSVEPARRFRRGSEPPARRDLPGQGGTDFESALQSLLQFAEEMAQMGTWDWRLETDAVRWSDNLYRIFGLEPGEITPTPEYVLEQTHPEDRKRVERQLDSARRKGQLAPLEYRIIRPDGEMRHLRSHQAVIRQAGSRPRRIIGSVQDVTDRRRAERMIAAHLAVAEALAAWKTFDQGAMVLIRDLASELGCATGVLWRPDGAALVPHVVWDSGSADVPELETVIRQLRVPRGVGLAGKVWETGEPLTALSLEGDPRFPAEVVDGVGGGLALPASDGGEVLAVLEFYSCQTVGADGSDRLLPSLGSIGRELGLFLGRRRGELKPRALTPRELEVLQLAAQGCPGREIAERLVVSPATVRTHFEHIYDKYGVSDRAGAVAKALREGLIE